MPHEAPDLDWSAPAEQDWGEPAAAAAGAIPAASVPVEAAPFSVPPATDDWATEVAQEQWSAGQPQAVPAAPAPNWGGSSGWD